MLSHKTQKVLLAFLLTFAFIFTSTFNNAEALEEAAIQAILAFRRKFAHSQGSFLMATNCYIKITIPFYDWTFLSGFAARRVSFRYGGQVEVVGLPRGA